MTKLVHEVFETYKDQFKSTTEHYLVESHIWQGISMLPRLERMVLVSKYYPWVHGYGYLTDKALGRVLRIAGGFSKELLMSARSHINIYIEISIKRGEL